MSKLAQQDIHATLGLQVATVVFEEPRVSHSMEGSPKPLVAKVRLVKQQCIDHGLKDVATLVRKPRVRVVATGAPLA